MKKKQLQQKINNLYADIEVLIGKDDYRKERVSERYSIFFMYNKDYIEDIKMLAELSKKDKIIKPIFLKQWKQMLMLRYLQS